MNSLELILEAVPEHMRILVTGEISKLIIDRENKVKAVLIKLYYAVPDQDNDHDWWPDELRQAMDEAKQIIE